MEINIKKIIEPKIEDNQVILFIKGLAMNMRFFKCILWSLLTVCFLIGIGNSQSKKSRNVGEKWDTIVYAPANEYASFPQIARTDKELVLFFMTQNLEKLRASDKHPHHQSIAEPRWAISRDGGLTWRIYNKCPKIGPIRDYSYGAAPLNDGGLVILTFSSTDPLRAVIQQGIIGYMPYNQNKIKSTKVIPVDDLGPFDRFYPHHIIRLKDGSLLAGGYVPLNMSQKKWRTTIAFLNSNDEGRSWHYRSHIVNNYRFGMSEPSMIETRDGRIVVLIRTDFDVMPEDERPAEARVGYGYFLYQSESSDNGLTWTEPQPTSIWGHPPYLMRLASGDILLLHGYRREPWEIRAILSRDECRSWDMKTLRTIHRFNPGNKDIGYPVATQMPDGAIVCTFYGYSTTQAETKAPHGIFVSIFDEQWLNQDVID